MNLVIFTFDLKKQILKNPVKMTPCNIYPSILIKPQLIGMSNCCITHLSIACVLFLLQTFVPPDRTFHVTFFVYSDIDELHATHLKYFHYLLYNPNMFSN